MVVYQIVEYDWVFNKASHYMETVFLRYTNLLFANEDDAKKQAGNMNYIFNFEKFKAVTSQVK